MSRLDLVLLDQPGTLSPCFTTYHVCLELVVSVRESISRKFSVSKLKTTLTAPKMVESRQMFP